MRYASRSGQTLPTAIDPSCTDFQSPLQNDLSGYDVPVLHPSASFAFMKPNSQRFRHIRAAYTGLRCAVGRHLYESLPLSFRFIRQIRHELSPSGIRDAFGQPAITEHVFHFQLLHRDHIMLHDDTVRLFMQKIVALPRDFLVDFRDLPFGFLPIAGTAQFAG
ncbi:hypothetical protein D3C73_1288700 [compost metagenome]